MFKVAFESSRRQRVKNKDLKNIIKINKDKSSGRHFEKYIGEERQKLLDFFEKTHHRSDLLEKSLAFKDSWVFLHKGGVLTLWLLLVFAQVLIPM